MTLGDKVQLKSGSPIMTISNLFGTTVDCCWFESNITYSHTTHQLSVEYSGKLLTDSFTQETLKLVE